MWDRLLVDCNIAHARGPSGNFPFEIIDNGAMGIADGKIVRVGKRTELAGYHARKVACARRGMGQPGPDRLPHAPRSSAATAPTSTRCAAPARATRRSREAGGGIASTVAKTAAASDEELLDQSRARLHALMRGGCTTVEVKSGYGLDTNSELRLLKLANQLGQDEAVRIVPTLLALHALPADQSDRRAHYVERDRRQADPAAAEPGPRRRSVDAFCETIAFTPEEVDRVFKAAAHHGLPRPPSRGAIIRTRAARRLPPISRAFGRPSRASRRGRRQGDGRRRYGRRAAARRLFYALQETASPPSTFCASTRCDRHRHRLQPGYLAAAITDVGDEHGVHPVRPDRRRRRLAGMTINAARALSLDKANRKHRSRQGRRPLRVAHRRSLAELGYWIGLPGPERRIFNGVDA